MTNRIASILLSGLLLFAGCDTRRDLAHDPVNSPIVYPLGLRYDEGQNAVVIEWEYLGIEPAARVQIDRVERDGIHALPWYDLPAPLRAANRRADVWDMMPIVDAAIQAGEKYIYILRTETAAKRPGEAPVGEVQIPGARLEAIHFFPEKGTATVNWHLPTGVLRGYALLRSVDGAAAEVIFQSEDPEVARFSDVLTEGNRNYTYRLRNAMDRGVVLNSRAMSFHPYKRRPDFAMVEAGFVALTGTSAFGHSALALHATSDAIAVRGLNQTGYVGDPQVLPVPNRAGLRSLSVAAIAAGSPVAPHVLLGGIVSETKAVQLSAFQRGVTEIPWQYEDWRVADSDLPTAMAVAPDGAIWAGVGQRLKAFSYDANAIVERGSYDTGTEGAVRSLAVLGSDIWMVTTLGEVFRADIRGMRSPVVWEAMALPAGVFPVWVGRGPDSKTIFVLGRDQVVVLNADGQSVLRWGLNDLSLDAAGLAVSEFEEVYVWDAQNRMVLFKTVHAFLVRFAEENQN